MIRKVFNKKTIIIFIICFTFLIGNIFTSYLVRKYARSSDIKTAQYFHYEISRHFGTISRFDMESYDVVDTFRLRNRRFLIIIEDGVKTIRAYTFLRRVR